jgi:muramoyltetrapeptide carboxypeptidase LdcA involved in peptidoglycan recycling
MNLMDRCPAQTDPLSADSLRLLRAAPGESVEQRSSLLWQERWTDFEADPTSAFALTEPTRWWTLHGEETVEARGRILAGCLDTWMHLVGTPYGDVPGWRSQLGSPCLLWLENSGLAPPTVVRALRQLRYAGWLDGLSALLLGRSSAEVSAAGSMDYERALRQSLDGLGCPVLVDVDFGHKPPQMTLIQGAVGELHWTAAGARLVQTLS